MNGIKTKVPLDMEVQMSVISKAWFNAHLNKHKVSKKEEILDTCDKLRVRWENQAEIRLSVGWTSLLNL